MTFGSVVALAREHRANLREIARRYRALEGFTDYSRLAVGSDLALDRTGGVGAGQSMHAPDKPDGAAGDAAADAEAGGDTTRNAEATNDAATESDPDPSQEARSNEEEAGRA